MEQRSGSQPLLAERATQWVLRFFRENKIPFLASIVFGLLAYTFAFTNKLINHDEVGQLFGKGATVSSGRWGLGALDVIFPNYSMPWIYGILTLVLMAVAVCFIIRIFSVRHKLLQVLLAGTVIVFPSLIGTLCYMFTSSSYALAFLSAVLAVGFIRKDKLYWAIPALACLILSLSIYQSYISICAGFLVLLLIQQLLDGKNVLSVLYRGIYFVVFLIVSLALYYAATEVVLRLKDVTLNSYADEKLIFSLESILNGVRLAYLNFSRFLSQSHHRLIPTVFSQKVHLLAFLASGVLLLLWMLRQKKTDWLRCLFLLLLIAILPLAINCMYLITSEDSIHTLVLYSFVSVYVLVIVLADRFFPDAFSGKLTELLRRGALNVIAFTLTLIIAVNTYVANEVYLNLHLRYENAYAFYSSLIADIKMMPNFTPKTRLAIVGSWSNPEFYYQNFDFTEDMVGTSGFRPNQYAQAAFLEYYLGFSIPLATDAEVSEIAASDEFAQMPVYPYYGSMKMIDDMLVVKLS